jgi:glucose-1-phosphatase
MFKNFLLLVIFVLSFFYSSITLGNLPMHKSKITTIIFDLGGVVIDVDNERIYQSIRQLGGHMDSGQLTKMLNGFEVGKLSETEFLRGVRIETKLPPKITDQEIITAWNSNLGNIAPTKISLIQQLRAKGYKILILSNTNSFHVNKINEIIAATTQQTMQNLTSLVDVAYYSYDMGLYKPNPQIYITVLQQENLIPEETLFLDDKEENLASAEQLGIKIIHIQDVPFTEILPKYLNLEAYNGKIN